MKKTIFLGAILFFTLSILILNSCQKRTIDHADPIIANQVNAWLEQQRSFASQAGAFKIQVIKEQLDYSKARIEELRANEKFLVVPLKESYSPVTKTKLPAPRSDYELVLILNNTGKIRKGSVAQYIPAIPTADGVPDNTYDKIFNHQIPEVDGRFRFYSLDEKNLYGYEYKNGARSTFSVAQARPQGKRVADNGSIDDETVCTDWYWVTYDSVTGEIISEEYLYTTCGDGGGGGGGGGGGAVGSDTPLPLITQKNWVVAANIDTLWYIVSNERLTGMRDTTLPGGGVFTNITHLGSSLIATPEFHWVEYNSVTIGNQGFAAYSYVSGTMTFPYGAQQYIPIRGAVWTFPEAFP